MTANQYNMPSFGEGLNFSDAWLDLPPQFMGTATSFGQQDGAPLASPPAPSAPLDHMDVPRTMQMSQLMPPPPPPPMAPSVQSQPRQQRHPDDVLNAAATLLQNGSSPRGGPGNQLQNNDFAAPRRPIPVGHLRHQPLEEFKKEGRRSSAAEQSPHDNTFTDWMWGTQSRQPQRNVPNTAPADFQWGSDSNFGPAQGYTPDPNKDSVEAQQKDQLDCLKCLEFSKSGDNTRHNSPGHDHGPSHANHRVALTVKKQEDADAPPRKRRKSKNVKDVGLDEDDEDDDAASTSTTKTARKRKPKTEGASGLSSSPADNGTNGAGGRRRKSAAVNGAKANRENLSEEQKRENHIKSEQKRRTLIKEGFDDLCHIVPGLRGGGFSKSTMLGMTAEWLEDMLKGNQELDAQLAALGR